MNDSVKKIARLSILTALGVVFLLLGNLVPAGRIALMVIASFPVCTALLMYGKGWACGVYIAITTLSLLLFPGMFAAAFALFFGYYPIAKSLFERLRKNSLVWILKYALYAAVFGVYVYMAKVLFVVSEVNLPWILLFCGGAIAYFVYDRCYTYLIQFYIERIARYFP